VSGGVTWGRLKERLGQKDTLFVECEARADKILADLNPVQRVMGLDPAIFKSGRCPRGAGKSHGATGIALELGERYPNKRMLIIGLTLKAAKENYWELAPGGVQAFNARYDLGLDINLTAASWKHQNGSVGFIAGAETAADLERLRGSKVEADLIVVDECKTFAPERLKALIQEILLPGLARRGGQLLLVSTPGVIPEGVFFEATCETARTKPKHDGDPGEPTCVPYALRNEPMYQGLATHDEITDTPIPRWSLHTWTIKDNYALPKMWSRALLNKRLNGWGDDHPVWRREYLGEWVENVSERVYAYAGMRTTGKVQWVPSPKEESDKHGLPKGGGPWHMLLGLDFGYEDDFAMVVLAYGEHDGSLYHVWDWKSPHLTLDQMQEEIEDCAAKFGPFEAIVADAGGLGKVLVETLMSRGIAVIRAEKTEKYDHIELVNTDFAAGRLKIQDDSELHYELLGLQWDLSKAAKELLVRTGRLKESPACPNHLCDAMLYVWRYAYHQYATSAIRKVDKYSTEWWAERMAAEKEAVERTFQPGDPNVHLRKVGRVDHLITR
jgi:hypothetical protein